MDDWADDSAFRDWLDRTFDERDAFIVLELYESALEAYDYIKDLAPTLSKTKTPRQKAAARLMRALSMMRRIDGDILDV